MTLPVFRPLDETAYGDETQLSSAHCKLPAENLLYCINERQGLASIGYTQRLGANGEQRQPIWTAAQWMLRGPIRVFVPGPRASQITAGYLTPKIVTKLQITVTTGEVYLVAFANRVPANLDGLATIVDVGDTEVDLDTFGVVAGWNDIYIAVQGEAQAATETGDLDRTVLNVGFFDDDEFHLQSPATGPAGPVSQSYLLVGDGAPTDKWRSRQTIIRSNSPSDHQLTLGEMVYGQVIGGTVTGSLNVPFEWGPLAYMQVHALSFDLTQGIDVDDEQRWPALRWWNLPSAFHLGIAVAQRVIPAHQARMPQLLAGADQVYAIGASSTVYIGGQWRFAQGGSSTEVERFRFAFFNAQETLSNQSMHLEICVPVMLSDVSGDEQGASMSLLVTVLEQDNTTVALGPELGERFVGASPVTRFVTARIAALCEAYEDVGNSRRECALDGFTFPADVAAGAWSWLSVSIDISTLTADTLYYVSIGTAGEPSDARTIVVYGDPAARYVYA